MKPVPVDATVRPTMAQLREMKRRLDDERAKLGPFGDPVHRLGIRDAIAELRNAINRRRAALLRRLADCDRMLATVAKPWASSAPPVPMIVWALLCQAGGRAWGAKLTHAAQELFELDRALVWATVRGFESKGLVRVHQHPGGSDGQWIELLAATGGDGVPPPDPHAKRTAANRSEAA